ncbi:hypothetical protein EJB05_00024 [Eragrostis curvula]|uniref:Major facilitator superfamily (MFS) profile domain-containing protein n=1 Tax=Eragrostis curvula TaxID=38414 RepID=A0A5J9WKY1_9POAL|nr:hypothetical protein EJB05_00024 [Eragrostis curvula]
MEATNKQQQPPVQEEHKAAAVDVKKKLSDDDDKGVEAEEKYHGWKAMPYVIGNETFEKLGTIGTTANLLVYLTTVYGMKSANAATLLNLFSGTTNLAPLLGAFLSDTYLGRYATLALASVASFLGMLLLTLTAAISSLHPHHKEDGASTGQMAVLLASFALIAVGAGGIRPCNLAFGADQFDPRTASGRRGIASFFNWYYFTFTIAMMVSATLIIYLQSNVSWPLGLAVPAALMGLSCALFFMGTRLYVRVRPEGSPFTSFARVLVAAYRKRRLPAPKAEEMFDPPHRSSLVTKIAYTDQFRCLDKAALVVAEDEEDELNTNNTNNLQWRLCTLQQVEEVKCLARILPVWSSGIIYYIVLTNLGNYAVLQAMQTDRRLGRTRSFEIPAGSFVVFNMLALTVWIPFYDRVLVPAMQRVTKREGGITQLQRIGTGLALSVLTMLVAAAVERRRRRIGDAASCFLLVPQQLLAGLSEAFALIGQVEFYYRQFPENMRSVAGALLFLGFAVASYASGLMVTVVHRTTGGPGRPDWLAQDLNQGRVDLYYLLIAAMAAVNLIYFLACARWFRFKKPVHDTNAAAMLVEMDGNHHSDTIKKASAAGPPV